MVRWRQVGDFKDAIRQRLASRREALLDLARSRAAEHWTDDDLDQLLRAFYGLLDEALTDESTATRSLFLETAVPAAVAAGETVASIAASISAWAVVLTSELVAELPPDERVRAAVWLADFFEAYARDVIVAAQKAERT